MRRSWPGAPSLNLDWRPLPTPLRIGPSFQAALHISIRHPDEAERGLAAAPPRRSRLIGGTSQYRKSPYARSARGFWIGVALAFLKEAERRAVNAPSLFLCVCFAYFAVCSRRTDLNGACRPRPPRTDPSRYHRTN